MNSTKRTIILAAVPASRPLLAYALLGLLARESASGYDLRKVFQESLLGLYSDSPGSIYPALRRLESEGLVRARSAAGGRRRRLLSITADGRRALEAWLREPPDVGRTVRDRGSVELRLAFLHDVLPRADLPHFLETYASSLDQLRAVAEAARDATHDTLSASAQVALDMGIHRMRSTATWCRRTARHQRTRP